MLASLYDARIKYMFGDYVSRSANNYSQWIMAVVVAILFIRPDFVGFIGDASDFALSDIPLL